ncbi:MAG: YwiC-like family protein, partial [Bacillota bacterium]|nr:YwiC-like family protein [Bacillota bacterium]
LLFKRKKLPFYTKWTLVYIIPAIGLLMIPLFSRPSLVYFGLLMIPFFFINAYFSSKNKDRAFANDVSAICAFSLSGLASSYLADGMVTKNALLVFFTSIMFFMGSTFYVKTLIREKKNNIFKWISWSYHIALPLIWISLGFWIVAFAFLPSLTRAIGFYGKNLSSLKIGIYEIANASLFFVIIMLQFIK